MRNPSMTFYAVNKQGDLRTNTQSDGPNAVTWGVFPGKEIVQPTVVETVSFMAWKVNRNFIIISILDFTFFHLFIYRYIYIIDFSFPLIYICRMKHFKYGMNGQTCTLLILLLPTS